MRQSLVDKLCCPFDKQDLELKVFIRDTEDDIKEGMLTCKQCKRYFPIVYGIPIMSPDEYRQPMLEAPILEKWENKLNGSYAKGFRLLNNENEIRGK